MHSVVPSSQVCKKRDRKCLFVYSNVTERVCKKRIFRWYDFLNCYSSLWNCFDHETVPAPLLNETVVITDVFIAKISHVRDFSQASKSCFHMLKLVPLTNIDRAYFARNWFLPGTYMSARQTRSVFTFQRGRLAIRVNDFPVIHSCNRSSLIAWYLPYMDPWHSAVNRMNSLLSWS